MLVDWAGAACAAPKCVCRKLDIFFLWLLHILGARLQPGILRLPWVEERAGQERFAGHLGQVDRGWVRAESGWVQAESRLGSRQVWAGSGPEILKISIF